VNGATCAICMGAPQLRNNSARFVERPRAANSSLLINDEIFRWFRNRSVQRTVTEQSRRTRIDGRASGQSVFRHRWPMDNLSRYINRPTAFILRYVRQRAAWHLVILAAVLAAVGCSVSTQYGVKYLVDI